MGELQTKKKEEYTMYKIKRYLTVMLIITALFALVAADAQAFYVTQSWTRISGIAGETITTGQAVCIKSADGLVYKAKADDATLRPAIGIAGRGAATGKAVEIIIHGIVTGWSSLSKGAPGFVSATAGLVTQSAPAYSQQIGIAINGTDYLINAKNYFDTSAITSLGVLSGATPLVLDGVTADGTNRITVTVTDQTAARTYTFPDVTGTIAFTSGVGSYKPFTILTNNAVLTTADCGKVYGIGTDAKTITIPATAAGCTYTFINTGANGNNIVELVPDAGDQFFGTVTLAASVVVVATTAGEHLLNTKASAKRGDSISIIGDGVDGWYITASTGIWAEATP
jgi:hypothetical protein